VEIEVKNSMQLMNRINEDKEIEQKQSRLWDPGKLQAGVKHQQHDKEDSQRQHQVWDRRGLQQI
jgi:hypothetical protein